MPSPSRISIVAAVLIVFGGVAVACSYGSNPFEPSASEPPRASTNPASPPGLAVPSAGGAVRPLPPPIGEAQAVQQPDGTFRFQPVSAPVVAGVLYEYAAFTHCGFTPTTFDFDGSFWRPVAPAPAGQGANPPAGIDNPEDVGTIALVSPNQAVFTSRGGIIVPLVRVEGPQEGFPCD